MASMIKLKFTAEGDAAEALKGLNLGCIYSSGRESKAI